MQPPHQEEEDAVGYRLVQLSGVSWEVVDTFEDERPGHFRHLADNLGVHQVAQSDEASHRAGGNGDIVQHPPQAKLRLFDIEPQGDDQTEGTAMTCQSLIANKLKTAFSHEADRQEHLDDALP